MTHLIGAIQLILFSTESRQVFISTNGSQILSLVLPTPSCLDGASASFFFLCTYLFMRLLWVYTAAHGLSLVAAAGSSSLVAVLVMAVAFLAAEHGLWTRRLQESWRRAQLLQGLWDLP